MAEKRSGRPSIPRKVQKIIISKSLHKRGRSTRKLATKLTNQDPQCSKTPSIDIWDLIFGAYSCKRPVLRKISRNQPAMTSVFQGVTEVDSLKPWEWLHSQMERSNVPVSAWNLQKWPRLGQKKVKSKTYLKFQVCSKNHSLGHNGSCRCVRATCVASKPNWESKV